MSDSKSPYETKPLYDKVLRIETQEEAEGWIRHLLENLEDARRKCDVWIPNNQRLSVNLQKSAERKFLIHYGSFTGVLRSMHATKWVSDSFYESHRQLAAKTLSATVIGLLQ